jgi:integrase
LDGKGLYLQVTDRGSKSWIFRYKDASAQTKSGSRYMGLGTYPEVSLDAARNAQAPAWSARRCREVLAAGLDPIAERERERAERRANGVRIPTFAEVVAEYLPLKSKGLRNAKHAAQWKTTLATYAASLDDRPVNEIAPDDVLAILSPIWVSKNETARRVRGRIQEVLEYAKACKHRTGENPAHLDVLRPSLKALFPGFKRTVEHHAALPWQKVGAFMVELRKREGMAARALEFAILTAARSGEVRRATWDEFDLNARLWTVPATRMKAGKAHRVPLSDAACALLTALPRYEGTDLVFPAPGGGPLSDDVLATLARGMADAVPHGFRSTFKDWYRNMRATKYPDEIAELALAHVNSDKTRAAYARDDLLPLRAQLMADWSAFCAKPKPPTASITSISNLAQDAAS